MGQGVVNGLVLLIQIFNLHGDLGFINGNAHFVVVLVLLLKVKCVGNEDTRLCARSTQAGRG